MGAGSATPNRYLFADRFDQALQLWRRHQTPFAVRLIDAAPFKSVHDQCGHEVEDQALTAIARRMKQELHTLIRCADHAMYAAKPQGRHTVSVSNKT